MKWGGRKRISIYRRLLITFLLVIVPIVALCLYIVELASENLKAEISVSMRSNVHFYLSSFETEMQRLQQLKKEFVRDDDLMDLSTIATFMSNYDKRVAILRLQKKLSMLKTASVYVDDVKADIPLIGRAVYPGGFKDRVAPVDEAAALRNPFDLQGSPLIVWKEQVYLVQPSPNLKKGEPVFLLSIALSQEKIANALSQIGNFEHSGAILYNPANSWMIGDESHSEISTYINSHFAKISDSNQSSLKIGNRTYLITQQFSPSLGVYLISYAPQDQFFKSLTTYKHMLLFLALMSVLLILFFSYRIYRLIQIPLNHLSRAFRKMENGDLNFSVTYRYRDEFGYLIDHFNAMTAKLQSLIHEVYEQKIHSQRSELKQLQSQIHPHFLYNSFFVLYRMAKLHNIDQVIRFTEHLTQYFQFMTRTAENEVDLEMEINHARAYLEIQLTRFGKSVASEFDPLPPGTEGWKVPRLILQPIIENSFKYALERKKRDGMLKVRFVQSSNFLSILIEDNGEWLAEGDITNMNRKIQFLGHDDETTGLLNVHRRLQLKLGADAGLRFSRSSLGGLLTELRIPKDGKEPVDEV